MPKTTGPAVGETILGTFQLQGDAPQTVTVKVKSSKHGAPQIFLYGQGVLFGKPAQWGGYLTQRGFVPEAEKEARKNRSKQAVASM